jgi:CheY-like chemotaxis protein
LSRRFGTLEAGSAAEAIALLERRPEIRVVFTDVQMPGTMDGLALAKYVRERWPLPSSS